MRIKDTNGGKVTVLSLGINLLRDVVKKPISMGADELILLEDEAFANSDSWSTANALSMAITKIGYYNLILCGRQASDWDMGQVGSGIAEMLGIPSVTLAKKIDVLDSKAMVERVIPDSYEVIELSLPALISVSNEIGAARYPTIKGIMASKKIEPIVWTPINIGVDTPKIGAAVSITQLVKLYQPDHGGTCEIIDGDTVEEASANLALKLREAKLL